MSQGGAANKTEKATPKKVEDARKKGQVARSADLNGAVVLIGGLAAVALTAPMAGGAMRDMLTGSIALAANPEVVGRAGIGELLLTAGVATARALGPVLAACLAAALLINILQVGLKPRGEALKPDPKRLNPLQGAKNVFGPRGAVEGVKAIIKVAAVAIVVAVAVAPSLDELAALVGMPPAALAARVWSDVLTIFVRGAAAYLAIGLADVFYQRWRHAKTLRMDKQEVKEEHRQQNAPAEVKSAQRRRAMMGARNRMMAAVPQADVVVTNPTHYAVALRYDTARAAPEVLAKGADLTAKRIRELAAEAGVPIVPDPPLARSLHASVEVGDVIPEELYHAVARVLAFVYRVARRRAA